MKYSYDKYIEIKSTMLEMLEILKTDSLSSTFAKFFEQHLNEPDFDDPFWFKFQTYFRRLTDIAYKYSLLSNEDQKKQELVKRQLSLLKMVDPLLFLNEFKSTFTVDNEKDISKKKLRNFIKHYLVKLPKNLNYKEISSTDYDVRFELSSKDQKKVLKFEVLIDVSNRFSIYGTAEYHDLDFSFKIEEIKFDTILFRTLESCVSDLMAKLDVRISMRVSGTRVKIAEYVAVLSNKDLAVNRANIISNGFTKIVTITGDTLTITRKPEGKKLDALNSKLFGVFEELYYNVE